ncbi:MAG TPA: hypothetical protein VGC91_03895 [Pyrinomonadaceae bacterium]
MTGKPHGVAGDCRAGGVAALNTPLPFPAQALTLAAAALKRAIFSLPHTARLV